MGDGSSPATAYDANGNIKRMQQWGINASGITQTDDLTYNYAEDGKSNRLLNVSDAFNDAQTRLGDFRVSALNPVQTKTTSTVDYSYDANGNMVKDLNKDIVSYSGDNGIVYNHLNLPQQVTIKKSASANKGTITYTYDAAGNKLKKTVVETGATVRYNGSDHTSDITTTTLYLGAMVYESKDYQLSTLDPLDYINRLQFIGQEEGRIRFKTESNSFEYDYFLKDHLGNVRAVLTEEIRQDVYPIASMETATSALENTYYSNIDNSRYERALIQDYPTTDNTTTPNDYVARTNGSDNKIGPGILLKVMSGDKFNISVKSWYKKNGATPGTPVDPLLSLIAALSSGVSGTSSLHGTAGQIESSGVLDPAVNGFLPTRESPGTDKPKAYLNYILLNEQLKFVSDEGSGSSIVGNDEEYKTHTITEKLVTKNGYLYIYVSNETPNIDVFFDNLQVNLKRGAMLEETHYYPFGLTMAGISSKALNNAPVNRFKFNDGTELANKEFSDGSGLEWYETTFRSYDPQIGRFHQIDPLSIISNNQSPYAYVMNNPLLFNDPLGLDTTRGNTPKPNPDPGDVWIPGKGPDQIFDADQGWTPNPVLQEVVVGGGQSNSNESYYTSAPMMQASFFNGDMSTSDAINVVVGFGGAVLNQVQAHMINYKNNTLLPKARANGFNSYYRRQIKNVDLGVNKLGKVGKGLGYAGLALQGLNLTDKYLNGEGITKKDVLDAGVSILLTVVAISNPAVLIGVGIYGLMDSFGAFDGIKEAIGANDDVILKR
ncbi:MAG: RHS repeat-associated core domain-containing protein [Agriterribacter sp.]